MSTWLITSFGLPVALTTGRLTALTGALPRHPADVLVALVVSVVLSAVTTSCIAVAHRRRRRASRRGSTS